MPKISKSLHIYVRLLPIAYHSLSTECHWFFLYFFMTHLNISFVLGNVFHDRDGKILYATLHQGMLYCASGYSFHNQAVCPK